MSAVGRPPEAPCTPGGCARHHGRAAGRGTAAVRLLAGLATVIAGLLLAPLFAWSAPVLGRARARRLRHRAVRRWTRTLLRALGVRVRIVGRAYEGAGRPYDGAALVVANHVSWLDIPLIAAVLPGRMLAKSEIGRWPLLGPLAARGGTLFVERDRLRTLPGTVREMASALMDGSRVVAFPEGSTWCGREQGPFRHAVFQAALDAGTDVRPLRITYHPSGAAAFVGDDTLLASLWRVVTVGELTAEIRLLPVIPAGRFHDRRSLARAARRAVTAGNPDPPAAMPRVAQAAAAAVERESANLPFESVHQFASSSPASASSRRTPS
ncbi:lysophospholipid acyltransferase family protein [Streptomyces sp. NPDC004726]